MGFFFFTTSSKAGKLHVGKTDPRNIPQNRPAKHTPKRNFLDRERHSKMQPHTAWKSMFSGGMCFRIMIVLWYSMIISVENTDVFRSLDWFRMISLVWEKHPFCIQEFQMSFLQPSCHWDSIGFCSRQPLYVDCASKTCNSDPFKVQVMRLEGNPAVVNNVLGTEPATFAVAFISFDFFSFDHWPEESELFLSWPSRCISRPEKADSRPLKVRLPLQTPPQMRGRSPDLIRLGLRMPCNIDTWNVCQPWFVVIADYGTQFLGLVMTWSSWSSLVWSV